MRALVVHAHPSPDSFASALFRDVCAVLVGRGYVVDACDLYAEEFDPVLPRATYRKYLAAPANRAGVEPYVRALMAAQALAFVFPVWHDGPPAILKGYFDRVFLRGVVFEVENGVFLPRLHNVRRLAAVVLYGADRERTKRVGDLPRRFVRHNLHPLVAPDAPLDYLAAYGMDHADAAAREEFRDKVRRSFQTW
ncbi:MAG: NAD(P)H-dependent oxidoreductase [Pseudomonadota bacterium]|nr:NAD(P)H-dependent oxidoreductase [Pseudomonadota bacterium]